MANSIYLAKVGTLQTARVDFVEDATSVSHTAMVPIPAGAVIVEISAMGVVPWGDSSARLDIGDTADPNGYVAAFPIDSGSALLAVAGNLPFSTNGFEDYNGAYAESATSAVLIGPTVNNIGWSYIAGSNLIITVNVTTPSATTGRTTVVVYYSVPASMPIVST